MNRPLFKSLTTSIFSVTTEFQYKKSSETDANLKTKKKLFRCSIFNTSKQQISRIQFNRKNATLIQFFSVLQIALKFVKSKRINNISRT